MYRLIKASADAYITNKIIENERATESNTGQAGTIDIYKLYDETEISGENNPVELSRGLIKFDYSTFANFVDVGNESFKAKIILKNVYGGQTTPSNFSLELLPLSKPFNEGRGFDVASYKDLDTANFIYCQNNVSWSSEGANRKDVVGNDADVYTHLTSGLSLSSVCVFARGDEDGIFDVTAAVSASIAGLIDNNGFRLSFIEDEEEDERTRFVKRFGSRQALSKEIHPKLIIEYNDRIFDTSSDALFDTTQSFYTYNILNGQYVDLPNGSNVTLNLCASKSFDYVTRSFQENFNQEINHKVSDIAYFSQSFNCSRVSTGVYNCEFVLDSTNEELAEFLEDREQMSFDVLWKDSDKVFSKQCVKFKFHNSSLTNSAEKNYIVNVTNLKQEYFSSQKVRMKVFVQDRTQQLTISRAIEPSRSALPYDMRWRLKKAYTKSIVVPFSESTKLSADAENLYFDIYMSDLDINEVYELEFAIKTDYDKDIIISRKGFTFKVVE